MKTKGCLIYDSKDINKKQSKSYLASGTYGHQPAVAATATTCVLWSWRLKECYALASAVKGKYAGFSGPAFSDGYATLMSPNRDETAVHCCHGWYGCADA